MRSRAIQFGVGLTLAVAYFLAPAFLISVFVLGILFWTTIGCVVAYGVGIGVVVALPLWMLAKLASRLHQRVWFGAVLFALAGAITAVLAVALMRVLGGSAFAPFEPFGASALGGTLVVTAYAALCSSLGWLTVQLHRTPAPFEDALGGLDFAELATLLNDHASEPHG